MRDTPERMEISDEYLIFAVELGDARIVRTEMSSSVWGVPIEAEQNRMNEQEEGLGALPSSHKGNLGIEHLMLLSTCTIHQPGLRSRCHSTPARHCREMDELCRK